MHFHFNKKAFLGLVGLLLVASMLAAPGAMNWVGGGHNNSTSVVQAAPLAAGRSFYVTTNGTSSGNGSMSSPWSLAYALNSPSSIRPGDTIWVRGGTYNGEF